MQHQEYIRLDVSDWLFNAGLVGFYNILKNYYNKEEFDEFVEIGNNFMKVDLKVINNFSEKYFKYFIDNYLEFTPFGKILNFTSKLEAWNEDIASFDEESIKTLNHMTYYMKEKLSRKSFKIGYELIDDKYFNILLEIKKLSHIKLKKNYDFNLAIKDIKEQIEIMLNIIDYLQREKVKRTLLSKEFTYSFTSDFLSNVSIWGRKYSSKDSFEGYDEYFVKPLFDYSFSKKSNYALSCISCGNLIAGKFQSDLTWIKGIGADTSKKISHYYKFNSDIFICPICNLIYSCIPAGFTTFYGDGFFINSNSTFNSLIAMNNFNNIYEITDIFKEDNRNFNIQIVKFDALNEKRPFEFILADREIVNMISVNKSNLNSVWEHYAKSMDKEYSNLFKEVLERIFKKENLFGLIGFCLKTSLQGRTKPINANLIMEIQKNILVYRYENLDIDILSKVECFNDHGMAFKNDYESIKKGNKVDLIIHKLLNALKTNNIVNFLDVVTDLYLFIEKEIPEDFLDILSNNNDICQLYGFAFVFGLQMQLKRNKKSVGIS